MPELRHQTVVIVAGAPGVGKSTVASRVAHALGATPIDIDAVFEPIVPLLAGQPRELVRTAIYESLVAIAEASLLTGSHVVVSAPFTTERRDPLSWDRLSTRLSSGGGLVALVWLYAPPEAVLERLAARGASRDSEKLADPASWLREAEPEAPPTVPHIAVDATQAPEHAAEQVLRELIERDRVAPSHSLSSSGEACSFSA
jgi:predicted kinase